MLFGINEYNPSFFWKIVNKPIKKVEPLIYNHKNFIGNNDVLLLNGIVFSVESFALSIFNALDCNGIELKKQT